MFYSLTDNVSPRLERPFATIDFTYYLSTNSQLYGKRTITLVIFRHISKWRSRTDLPQRLQTSKFPRIVQQTYEPWENIFFLSLSLGDTGYISRRRHLAKTFCKNNFSSILPKSSFNLQRTPTVDHLNSVWCFQRSVALMIIYNNK